LGKIEDAKLPTKKDAILKNIYIHNNINDYTIYNNYRGVILRSEAPI